MPLREDAPATHVLLARKSRSRSVAGRGAQADRRQRALDPEAGGPLFGTGASPTPTCRSCPSLDLKRRSGARRVHAYAAAQWQRPSCKRSLSTLAPRRNKRFRYVRAMRTLVALVCCSRLLQPSRSHAAAAAPPQAAPLPVDPVAPVAPSLRAGAPSACCTPAAPAAGPVAAEPPLPPVRTPPPPPAEPEPMPQYDGQVDAKSVRITPRAAEEDYGYEDRAIPRGARRRLI